MEAEVYSAIELVHKRSVNWGPVSNQCLSSLKAKLLKMRSLSSLIDGSKVIPQNAESL